MNRILTLARAEISAQYEGTTELRIWRIRAEKTGRVAAARELREAGCRIRRFHLFCVALKGDA
jgi:hypothetical protein